MSTSTIRRQHENTSIPELRGTCCTAFKAVIREQDKRLGLLYIQLFSVWHRFFLDAGLLFWEEGRCPDPDDDVLEGEHYIDLGESLRVIGASVQEIEMRDSTLTLQFDNRARLVLRNAVREVGSEVVESAIGR